MAPRSSGSSASSPTPTKKTRTSTKPSTPKPAAKAAVKRVAVAKAPSKTTKLRITNNTRAAKATTTHAHSNHPLHTHAPKKSAAKAASPIIKSTSRNTLLSTLKRNPLGHLLVEQKLREAGFRGGVSTDKALLEKYSTDESIFAVRPQIVIQPKDAKDVERAVRVIAAETKRFSSLSLTPRAAGTGLSGGSLTDSIVIDVCAHLTKIHEVSERKGKTTITLEPGVMWRTMEKRLKQHGVYLPPYTSSKDICSVGGSIANNAAGPDSLRYGHCAEWVESMNVVLRDGHTYTIEPITYKEFKALTKKDDAYADILTRVFTLLEKNEKAIKAARPKTKSNAGYALWDVIDGSVADFKKGKATMNLGRLISGSQGTIGVITSITLRTEPIAKNTALVTVPVFDLAMASDVILAALTFDPINIELFDDLTFDLALKNPGFFKQRLEGIAYYKMVLAMYTTYHIRWRRKTPAFTFLITIDKTSDVTALVNAIAKAQGKARHVTDPDELEMFLQIRRASYTLSKLLDPNKRPAAFLEDMTVPPEHLGSFFRDIKRLFKQFNVNSAVHGHGGNGHFHFYPLLDFTKQGTGDLVMKMAEEFYTTAVKYKGSICGEHNDGIIRTPHLSKLFKKQVLDLFKEVEHIFDPDDIFNPGKKVNPRFDIKETLRHKN
jgi:FAD/FMN-containing dehydrogenase